MIMLPIFLLLLFSVVTQVKAMEPEEKPRVTLKLEKPKDDTRPSAVNPEWRAKVRAHNEKAHEIDQYLPGTGYTKLHAWAPCTRLTCGNAQLEKESSQ